MGVCLDRKPNIKHHTKTTAAVAIKAYRGIGRLGTPEKGILIGAVCLLYIPCITTIQDYSAEIWWKGKKNQIKSLVRIQNQAITKITMAFRTTPITMFEAELTIPNVNIRLKQLHQK